MLVSSTKNNTKLWLLSVRRETDLNGTLSFIKSCSGMRNPDLFMALVLVELVISAIGIKDE